MALLFVPGNPGLCGYYDEYLAYLHVHLDRRVVILAGMAIVTGKPKGVKNAKTTISAICVYDKKTKKAEIGGEIPASQLTVKPGN